MLVNRRRLILGTTVGSVGVLGAVGLTGTSTGSAAQVGTSAASDQYAAAVDEGLASFKTQAARQLPLVDALEDAIRTGDLTAARTAYVVARPPYEEIEVLAASFPETDEAIDARPYAIDGGEASEDFRGFHRIEALIYRDDDLARARPYAEDLVASARQLILDLEAREHFSAVSHFEGMIGLATEVVAKKISSEEETWSDQSLLIFRHNWLGIGSQFEPFAVYAGDAGREVQVALEDALAIVDPYFSSGSPAAAPYSTVETADRQRITQAGYRLRDALLAAGSSLGLA